MKKNGPGRVAVEGRAALPYRTFLHRTTSVVPFPLLRKAVGTTSEALLLD